MASVFRVVLAFAFADPALARDAVIEATDTDEDEEQTVVVTANRLEQKRFEARRSVEAIGREKIDELQVRSVPELMDEIPGVFLQQTNRGAGAPFIRGLVGPQNLILVDGVRFTTSTHRTGPNQYLALIDPFGLARLEVVRGPSSVLYGNGAMGGVLQAVTADPEVERGDWRAAGRAGATLSSADLSSGGAFSARASGRGLAVSAGLSVSSFGSLRSGGGAEQPLSDYHASYWNAKAIYAPGDDWSISGTYLGAALRDTGRADQLGRGDLRFYDDYDHLAYVIFRHRGGEHLKRIRASLSYQRLDEHVDRYGCRTGADGVLQDRRACLLLDESALTSIRIYDDSTNVLGADANLGLDLWSDRIRLNVGFQFYHDLVSSGLEQADADTDFAFADAGRGNFSDGSAYTTMGMYLHGEATCLDLGPELGELRASGGVRFSRFRADADDVPVIGDVEYGFEDVVGTAGVQYVLPGAFNVYFSFVQGFRAPNLQETTVLGDTGSRFEVPNPNLGPERSNTLELGARLNLGPVEAEAAYHYSFLTGAITQQETTYQGRAEINGKQVTRLVNGEQGVIQGADLALRLHLWRLVASAAASWTQGDVTTDLGATPARRIPPLFGRAGLRYTHPDRAWFAEAFVRWALRQDRLHPSDLADARICETGPFSGLLRDPCDGTPGWATLNARLGFRIDDRFRLDLLLGNLTDARYRRHGSGLDAPGIDLRVSVTASL